VGGGWLEVASEDELIDKFMVELNALLDKS